MVFPDHSCWFAYLSNSTPSSFNYYCVTNYLSIFTYICLCRIFQVEWAKKPSNQHLNCFWYAREKEKQLVYADYWTYMERTGRIEKVQQITQQLAERKPYFFNVPSYIIKTVLFHCFVDNYQLNSNDIIYSIIGYYSSQSDSLLIIIGLY